MLRNDGSTTKAVLATGNAGKLREMAALLAPIGFELRAQGELGIAAAPETGVTFVENALQKARHASRSAKLPAIADDSGLVVPALGGAPGVRSARYAGDDATDADNNRKLIGSLVGIQGRTAWFYCALVFIERPDDPAPLLATGTWRGRIIDQPRGEGGFGYDPHFLVPHLGRTSAELAPEEKNALSHRGQAVAALLKQLRERRARP
ncbi:MAG: RdgB/HAM1 family non-canonical purine NTP pyrophosphatase [Gammaproteobacteria bacterium]|nr:RdgB/HAM1 family non-canonical purine NTP pyrophosphatase [Gammaproteobacteria bacterium]